MRKFLITAIAFLIPVSAIFAAEKNLPNWSVSTQKTFDAVANIFGAEKFKNLKIEIFTDETAPRALAGANILKLQTRVLSDPKLAQLLTHELAHVFDLGFYRGNSRGEKSEFVDGATPIFADDLSVQFYRISWKNSAEKLGNASVLDFVSGYAASDPFEDFAESVTFFVFKNRDFQKMAAGNDALSAKFKFIKNNVFGGKVFDSGDGEIQT